MTAEHYLTPLQRDYVCLKFADVELITHEEKFYPDVSCFHFPATLIRLFSFF